MSELPSPQLISYWLALPTTESVNVTLKGLPPELALVEASTLLTYVLFLIFSVVSFNLSIASATVVELVKLGVLFPWLECFHYARSMFH